MSVADPIYDPEEESYLINGTGEPEYALMPVCVLTDTSLCEKSKIVYLTFRALSPNNMGFPKRLPSVMDLSERVGLSEIEFMDGLDDLVDRGLMARKTNGHMYSYSFGSLGKVYGKPIIKALENYFPECDGGRHER